MSIPAAYISETFAEAHDDHSKKPVLRSKNCEYDSLATPEQRQKRIQNASDVANKLINDRGSDFDGRFIIGYN